ncbi:methionine-tRNA ligase [Pneumocystis carinii B80]|uniref:Probable methionine--tRNA ligase, mitochondrial n=1 Tax=Pneumocystis carinii (strain B80) TaxID=1408658 RepID=A0A0W4ZP16_PNEC8|nr:methionine-tRNA ligase [Pneumocystis carinii B80]KTW30112.1 methionine-tRNA ligase [Pneumocystis carinii B80]
MKLIYTDPYSYKLLVRCYFSRKNSSFTGKTYYITTPIFYVNSDPHIGHLYNWVFADVIQRYLRLKDQSVILRIGTDEHGIKVEKAALKSGLSPSLFCEKMSERFKYLAKLANIDHKDFSRTTNPKHCQSVQCFWKVLRDKGYIYENKHEGWYAARDETFYPSKAVKKIRNSDGAMSTISIETGANVEWISENNYHFRLSKFKNQLLDHYRKNPCFVIPRSEQNNLYHMIEQGLNDISISRPSSRYSWGIRVPDDESQTIYVWFDALLSYITNAGYPWSNSMLGEWPANVHLIGKDILRFHCILWPALLLAADLPLPYQIVSHSHWTMNNIKMSKSLGNIVDPFFKIQTFGIDPVRYFLIKEGRLDSDKNYDLSDFIRNYNVDLRGKLGNLLLRVYSSHFDLKRALLCSKEYVDKNTLFQEFDANINTIAEKVDDHMSKFQLHAALQSIFHFITSINKFFQDFEPWKYYNQPDNVDPVIYRTLEAIRLSAILLKPFIPEKASEILDQLDVHPSRRSFKFCKLGLDKTYLQIQSKRNMLLFPKLPSMYSEK